MNVRAITADIHWRKLALAAGLLLIAFFLFTNAAYADPPAPAPTGTTLKEAAGKCKDFPGLTNKIAACVRLTLLDISDVFFEGFYKIIIGAVTAFITFVILVYGAMTAMGMLEKPSRDTMVLALKLSLVTYFISNVPMIYQWDMDMMDAAGEAVVSFVPDSGPADTNVDYGQITCLKKMQEQANSKPQAGNPVVGPWLAIDCVLDSVIGLKRKDADAIAAEGMPKWYNDQLSEDKQGLSRGLLRFFFSNIQDSAVGLLIGIIGLIFIYSLIFLVIKSLFTYLGGYIAITFLLIFAPLFIPLVLFRTTREYFDKWAKLMLSMSLQPIFMLLFITMSIVAMDLAMFSGDYSVMYKIAGERSREKGFNLNDYLDEHEAVKAKPKVAAEVKAERESQQCGPLARDPNASPMPLVETFINQGLSRVGAAEPENENCRDYPIRFWHDSIDWEKLANARNPGVTPEGDATPAQQIAREVLSSVIFAGIVIFVMKGLLSLVPAMANDIMGDFGVSPNLYAQMGSLPGQQQLSAAARQLSGNLGTRLFGRQGGG